MKEITVLDKKFRELIPEGDIQKRIDDLASRIAEDYRGRDVVFIGILNGAFLYAAELFKRIKIKARISFVKLASYEGTSSSGTIKELIGWKAADIKVTTLLLKPDAYTKNIPLDYVGFEIPNEFVVGFGLDYNGYGRNLSSIYMLVK
jgi:hypoxanthine-guanine phosphoribosyltransferase